MKRCLLVWAAAAAVVLYGGENLLSNGDFEQKNISLNQPGWKVKSGGWFSSVWVHMDQSAGDYREYLKKLLPLASKQYVSENGRSFARLTTAPEAMNLRDRKGKMVSYSNFLLQNVPAECATAAKFTLKFRLRGRMEANGKFAVMLKFFDAEGKRLGVLYTINSRKFLLSPAWREEAVSFGVPAGCAKIEVGIGFYGSGVADLDDVAMTRQAELSAGEGRPVRELCDVRSFDGNRFDRGGVSMNLAVGRYAASTGENEGSFVVSEPEKKVSGLAVRFFPSAFIDNCFYIPQGQTTQLLAAIRNLGKTHYDDVVLVVKAPGEISVDTAAAHYFPLLSRVSEGERTVSRFKIPAWKFGADYNVYRTIWLKAESSAAPGEKRYPVEYFLEYGGNLRSVPFVTDIRIMPRVSGVRPKLFRNGVDGWLHMFDAKSARGFADFYAATGCNIMAMNCIDTVPVAGELARHGIERYFGNDRLANGYTAGVAPKPENVLFRDAEGNSFKPKHLTPAHPPLCPGELARGGEYFQKHVIGYIEEMLFKKKLGEHVLVNWEPYCYNGAGCFCDNCKKDFLAFSRLTEKELAAVWPKKVIGTYGAQWQKFRSHQSGRGVVNLQRGMDTLAKKYGRAECNFLPEISIASVFRPELPVFAEYNPADYMYELPWIEPWGPYIYSSFTEGYQERIGIHANMKVAAEKMREFLAKRAGAGKKIPKLMAFPHAFQCNTWVTEPEALGFETLIFFVENWQGSCAYRINGYDARHYQALANANTAIAATEEVVMNGVHAPEITVEPELELGIKPAICFQSRLMPESPFKEAVENTPLLYCRGFAKGKVRLAAVGNFYERSELYGKVKFPALAEGEYTVSLPVTNRLVASPAGKIFWTARELSGGVPLPVGALRWEFCRVEPRSDRSFASTAESSFWEKSFRTDRAKIAARLAFDRESGKSETVAYDFGDMPSQTGDGVKAFPRDGMNSAVVRVEAPGYSADLDMGDGGTLKNCKVNGRLLSAPGGIGRDGVFSPLSAASAVSEPLRLSVWNGSPQGVEVVLERKLSPKKSGILGNTTLRKEWSFGKNSIRLTTVVKNSSERPLTFGFRSHNALAGGTLTAREWSRSYGGKPQFHAASGSRMGTVFGLPTGADFPGDSFVLTEGNAKLKLGFAPSPAGAVIWDGVRVTDRTLEPLWREITLAPGEKIEFRLELIPEK